MAWLDYVDDLRRVVAALVSDLPQKLTVVRQKKKPLLSGIEVVTDTTDGVLGTVGGKEDSWL